jgi:hypothetical protein
MCGTDVEDGWHLFFKCKKVKALWIMILIDEQRRSLAQIASTKEAVQYIMNQKTEKVEIAILLWSWWSERNNVKEENSPREARQIRRVEVYTAEIMQIMKKKPSKFWRQSHKWNKPRHETLKLNCDAAYKKNSGQGGWDYVIRDSNRDVVRPGWRKIPSVMYAFQTEAIACLQGAVIGIGAR